jgi:mannose-6-phosphate isomerase-like protein (cupin superfamily)
MKKTLLIPFALILLSQSICLEAHEEFQPLVVENFLEKAKKNDNWKTAFVTGKQEQIVLMNVSPATTPNNEIGMEVHPFDQVILIVEGKAKVILNGKSSIVKNGDMVFIPQGTSHNVINLNTKKELKLISFYSQRDIPKDAVYKQKSDQPS